MKKESIDNELKNLSPRLRELRQGGDGFKLPEGYFEALEDSVFSRIDAMGARRKPTLEAKSGNLFVRFFRPQVMVAAAAAITLALAAVWFFRPEPTPAVDNLAAMPELSEEDIEAYVLENIRDFDANQLASISASETTPVEAESSKLPENQTKNKQLLDGLSEDELELLLKEMSEKELESLL